MTDIRFARQRESHSHTGINHVGLDGVDHALAVRLGINGDGQQQEGILNIVQVLV